MIRPPNKPALLSLVRRKSRACRQALLLLSVLLLFSQSADLIHSHAGGLERQVDCEICLKFGSSEESSAAYAAVPLERAATEGRSATPAPVLPVAYATAQPRAPPLV